MRTQKARRIQLSVLIPAGIILSTAVVLLETAFFHINPFKPGFNRFDFGEYVILAAELPAGNDYGFISTIMAENEAALGLHYRAKVQIILCEKQLDLNRFQPLLSAADKRNAVAVAPWPNTIYLTPKATEEYGSILVPIGHELSHILLIQNYGVVRIALLRKRAEWIPEGFAIYLNNWPNYFPRTELLTRMKDGGVDLQSTRFLTGSQLTRLPLSLRFMIYRYFVESLYKTSRSPAVVEFIRRACDSPRDMTSSFEKSFGHSLDNYWQAFRMSLAGS